MNENGYFLLSNGSRFPRIGLGTDKVDEASVKYAISEGYHLIDCAYVYGNEEEVGKAISAKINGGAIKREDLFIISKLASTHNEPDKVEICCKQSLEKLGLTYLDLYLVHWPVAVKDGKALEDFGVDVCYTETWKAMETLVSKGYCKNIGVSNFNKAQLEEILSICSIKPMANQVEVHPYFSNSKLVEYCKKRDIIVLAYSPLGSPGRGKSTRFSSIGPNPLEDNTIKEIASLHNVLPAQVILKWLAQRGVVPIPKSVTPERIKANIQLGHFTLTSEDTKRIDDLNIPFRIFMSNFTRNSKYFPFHDEY